MNVPFLQTATFTGLVSTDEYLTSKEWSDAYTISTFYAQNSAILIEQTTYSQLTAQKANNSLKPGQYYQINDFQLLWRNQSVNDQTIKSSSVIEPLLVVALSTNRISAQAYSTLHPQDIIYYDIDATTSYTWGINSTPGPGAAIPGFKGWIVRRIDTTQNIDIGWDWRYITNNCCKFNIWSAPIYDSTTTYNAFTIVRTAAGKLYFSLQNNNINRGLTNATWWSPYSRFVEADIYFPTNESGSGGLLSFSPILSTRVQLPTFTNSFSVSGQYSISNVTNIKIASGFNNIFSTNISNNTFGYNCTYNFIDTGFQNNTVQNSFFENIISPFVRNNTFGDSFRNNIITWIDGTSNDSMQYCKFGDSFTGNLICGSNFIYNVFGNNCADNFFSRTINNNLVGENFSRNKLTRFIFNNKISDNCTDNNFETLFTDNKIENDFINNIVGTSFFNNSIKNDFSNNIIGNNFANNTIDNNFFGNTVGDNASNNSIKNDFTSNTIGTLFTDNTVYNFFQNNTVGNSFSDNTIFNNFTLNVIGNSFNNVLSRNNISGINFTSGTHVYNTYDKIIFLNSNNEKRMSYNNENDQLVITDPNL